MKICMTSLRMSGVEGRTLVLEHFVALVENEVFQFVQLNVFSLDQIQHSARTTHHDGWRLVAEQFDVGLFGNAAEDDFGGDVLEVLEEPVELLLDLEGQFSVVRQHHGRDWVRVLVQLVEQREDEDGGLAHSGLGLAQDVDAHFGLGDALLLH